MTTETKLNLEGYNEDNARQLALIATERIHYFAGEFRKAAGTPAAEKAGQDLDHVRACRNEIYAWYENHFGLDLVDELLEECDEYFNDLTGIAR